MYLPEQRKKIRSHTSSSVTGMMLCRWRYPSYTQLAWCMPYYAHRIHTMASVHQYHSFGWSWRVSAFNGSLFESSISLKWFRQLFDCWNSFGQTFFSSFGELIMAFGVLAFQMMIETISCSLMRFYCRIFFRAKK